MNRLILTLIASLAAGLLVAGDDAYTFRQPEKTRPLFGSCVNALLEDNQGYLWIGTDQGLYRYDGYEMQHLTPASPSRLPADQHVGNIQEDASHHLWISASGASNYLILTPQRDRVDTHAYLQSIGMTTDSQYLMHIDPVGNLWRITTDSVCYYDFAHHERHAYATPAPLNPSNHRIAVKSSDGMLYILDGSLLYTFLPRQNVWNEEQLDMNLPTLGSDNQTVLVADMYVDHRGNLWVYSLFSEEILYRNLLTMQWQRIALPRDGSVMQNSIRHIVHDEGRGIWIATNHRGLFLYHPTTGMMEQYRHQTGEAGSLASNNINTLTVDRHHTLWLAHFKAGISYCRTRLNLLSAHATQCSDVTALWVDDQDTRWIGTDGSGLWYETPDRQVRQVTSIPNLTITDLQHDGEGMLWVATYDHGLYRIDAHGSVRHYDAQSGALPHDGIQRVALDGEGRLWCCSSFGPTYCFDPRTERSFTISAEEGQDLMGQTLCYDAHNRRILIGTYYGIWVYDLTRQTGHRMLGVQEGRQPLPVLQLTNFLPDDLQPLIWMTHNDGITVWDVQSDSLYLIAPQQGLKGKVQAIRQDRQHNLWASTVQGLSMIRASRHLDGSWGFVVRNYLSANDALDNLFNPYAGAATTGGRMLFGSLQGYTEIDCQTLLQQAEAPLEPRVASVTLGDSLLTFEQLRHLHYNDHPLTFRFYTGNPLNAADTRFAYRIVGLQEDWIETSSNSLTLLTLPAGHYTFELRAMGLDSEWSSVTSLPLRVSPPWWFSLWMWLIYVVLAIAVGFVLVWITRNRQRHKALEERRHLIQQQQAHLAEMKLQFFTDISHDLRTPLTLIISPLEQLLKERLPEAIQHRLQLMNRNAQMLLSEITTLLDFRKIDVGAEQLRRGEVRDVVTFIHEQCDQYTDVARDRQMLFRVEAPAEPILTSFDEDKMRKILYNLLSNAFKHSPDRGEVVLRIETLPTSSNAAESQLLISVSDQGAGVPDGEKERIFELFYQVKGDNPKPGSGIGLHIARHFVELHGGRLWVEDNQPKGAMFMFSIPILLSPPKESEPVSQTAVIEAPQPSSPDESESHRPHLLVVDDNRDLCHFIEESLMNDYRVSTAFDGEEALRVLEHEDITLVVSDVMMPGISGLELCNRIKSDLRFSHIPVILLTARAADQSILEGLQQGADDYLTKPFNVDRLRLRIAKFIEWAQRSHQTFQQQPDIEPRAITITPLDEQFLQKVLNAVNDHLGDATFGVEQLATEVCTSRSQLYKKLMAITGKSPLDLIRTLRMKRACQYLSESQLQVGEIAYQVGYNALKTFSENFKQEYGVTPTEWRNRH